MINLRIANGVFTVRFWPTLLTIIMLAALVALGLWQVQRLHWKNQLIATIDAHLHDTPVDVSTITNTMEANYRPAKTSGLFQYDKELYLTAISLTGEGGYHVLTPLRLDDGRMLLVDRGWVPYDHKLPATRPMGQIFGPVAITGVLRVPRSYGFHAPNDPAKNIWYAIDLAAMAQAAGVEDFMPFLLEADAAPNLGGYPVGGQTRVDLSNNHFVYALTWFSLAAALILVYGLSGYRKVS